MGIKDIGKDIENLNIFSKKKSEVEFSGLSDKNVEVEKELNL